jgi:hypothetical protein
MLVLLKVGIYEVRRLDGLRWHDIHTKFHKNSKVVKGGCTYRSMYTHTDSKAIS